MSNGRIRLRQLLRDANQHQQVVRSVRALRRLLPGSGELALAGTDEGSDRLARLIAQAGDDQPSAVKELGIAGTQIWQALTRPGPASGDITIMFTDLVGFSTWALEAGDDQVLRLLREVAEVTNEVITRYRGTVVKSLGDGVMAVFSDPVAAIEAAAATGTAVSAITLKGGRPLLRVGLHSGQPQRVGRDYLGVDVNIAARIADAAAGGEVLVSGQLLARVDAERYVIRRRRRFHAKGTPKELTVYSVIPRHT